MREQFNSSELKEMVKGLQEPITCLLQSLPASVKPTGRDLYGDCGASLPAFSDWSDFGDSGFGDAVDPTN